MCGYTCCIFVRTIPFPACKQEEETNTQPLRERERERERDVGIICVIIYDDLALKAWTQSEPMIEFAVSRER